MEQIANGSMFPIRRRWRLLTNHDKAKQCVLALIASMAMFCMTAVSIHAENNGSDDYIEGDEFKLYTANPLGKLVLVPATIIINPKNEDAGVYTRFRASHYAVLFNSKMRHKILEAVEQYLKDFENKKLRRFDQKSSSTYGRGEAYINYGTLSMMMTAEGKPKAQIGYKFKGKSPYFAITVLSAPNIAPNMTSNDIKESDELVLYFTRAQAQTMHRFLRDEAVQEALAQNADKDGEYSATLSALHPHN